MFCGLAPCYFGAGGFFICVIFVFKALKMTVQELYNNILLITNKDKFGKAFTPNDYNDVLSALNRPYIRQKAEELGLIDLRTAKINLLASTKLLHNLLYLQTSISPTVGVIDITEGGGDLDKDFAFWGTMITDSDAVVHLVDEQEYQDRKEDSILTPSATNPVARLHEDEIVIDPTSISSVDFTYIRYPETPFLDYYIDTSGVIQYLAAGATHTWATGEIDSDGTTHTAGDADWSSNTQELEIGEHYHLDFMNYIMGYIGVRLEIPPVSQYAEGMKQQEKQT